MAQQEKYRVIRKIDAGGMAEVFQGVAESLEGFSKQVAIKRVLPHLVENKKFLAMFLDEARLSMRMNHANVVHVFDIGRSGGTYFIVMEFVDGTDTKKLMERMRERRERLPLELGIFIMVEVCRGLAYAHQLRDSKGQVLGIVHRDISPPNILLSKQGEVKLVDFGLAKATSQLEHTDPGVVKGKFAYLSPEAAWGKDVDRRADIFACGVILFELITGKRLFLGENDIATVELVRKARVPSLAKINADIKPELETIVRKALAYEQTERYQTCDELAEDLAGYLFTNGLKVTSFDLRRMVKRITDEQAAEEPSRPSIIDQLIQEELGTFATLDAEDSGSPIGHREAPDTTGAQALNPFGFEDPRGWDAELQVDGSNTPLPEAGVGGWRESGLHDRREVGAGSIPPDPEPDIAPASLAQMLEGEVRMGGEAPPEGGSKRPLVIGILVALGLLAGAAVVAYLMGVIP